MTKWWYEYEKMYAVSGIAGYPITGVVYSLNVSFIWIIMYDLWTVLLQVWLIITKNNYKPKQGFERDITYKL